MLLLLAGFCTVVKNGQNLSVVCSGKHYISLNISHSSDCNDLVEPCSVTVANYIFNSLGML